LVNAVEENTDRSENRAKQRGTLCGQNAVCKC